MCVCSVHLARRVLQLEKQNTLLRRDLERQAAHSSQISEEVLHFTLLTRMQKHTYTHIVPGWVGAKKSWQQKASFFFFLSFFLSFAWPLKASAAKARANLIWKQQSVTYILYFIHPYVHPPCSCCSKPIKPFCLKKKKKRSLRWSFFMQN